MKDLWLKEYERLFDELGREPTIDEIETAVVDILANQIDNARDYAQENIKPSEDPKSRSRTEGGA